MELEKKKFALRIKPLELRPLKMQPLTIGGASLGSGTLPDAGGQPEATFSEKQEFKKDAEKYVKPSVISHLKSHKEDVLHGSQSLKMLLPSYSREPKDFDIYSKKEKKTAQTIESKIDKKFGKNVVATKPQHVPNFSGREDPTTSGSLFRIVPVGGGWSQDAYVDIMKTPKKVSTTRKGGITHESLIDARKKAEKRIIKQPLQGYKARSDVKDIDRALSKRMKDTDKDGVPDRFDCDPRDPNRQGWWHKLTGRQKGKAQEMTEEIESYDFDEKTGEYSYKPRHKAKGEKGYIKEGFKEVGQDVARGVGWLGKKAEAVGEKLSHVGEGMVSGETSEAVGEHFQRKSQQWGENIKSGLKVKQQPREIKRQYQRQMARNQATGVPRQMIRIPLEIWNQAIQAGYTPEQLIYAGYYPEEPEQQQHHSYGYRSNRSQFYQEQSKFGPSVVPYRPISRRQVSIGYDDIMAPNVPVKAPYQEKGRTPWFSSQHSARISRDRVYQPPFRAHRFFPPFIRLGYRRRVNEETY